MPRVCASSRRSPRNDSLLRPRRFCRATPRAGPPACRRPSASTDRGGGGRTPPRTPSIAAGSVVAAPPTVAVTREVFFQPSSRRRRGGRWSWFSSLVASQSQERREQEFFLSVRCPSPASRRPVSLARGGDGAWLVSALFLHHHFRLTDSSCSHRYQNFILLAQI